MGRRHSRYVSGDFADGAIQAAARRSADRSLSVDPQPGQSQSDSATIVCCVSLAVAGWAWFTRRLQRTLDRRVAIKVLPGHLFADEKLRTRFRRGVAGGGAASSYEHRAGLRRWRTGWPLHYYVMQQIEGRNLDLDCPTTSSKTRRQGDKETRRTRQTLQLTATMMRTTVPSVSLSPYLPVFLFSAPNGPIIGVQVADAHSVCSRTGCLASGREAVQSVAGRARRRYG